METKEVITSVVTEVVKVQNELETFISENKISKMCSPVWNIVNNETGEIVWYYAYLKVGKPLYIKYFDKFKNFRIENSETGHNEFTKDNVKNKVFEATLNKLRRSKPVEDLSMF